MLKFTNRTISTNRQVKYRNNNKLSNEIEKILKTKTKINVYI